MTIYLHTGNAYLVRSSYALLHVSFAALHVIKSWNRGAHLLSDVIEYFEIQNDWDESQKSKRVFD